MSGSSPSTARDDDLVALLNKHAHHVEDGVLSADAHDAFLGSYDEPRSRLCHAQMASRSGMMPPVGVYFDLFSSMALIAAFLMWSGVGSPARRTEVRDVHAGDFSLSASGSPRRSRDLYAIDAVRKLHLGSFEKKFSVYSRQFTVRNDKDSAWFARIEISFR